MNDPGPANLMRRLTMQKLTLMLTTALVTLMMLVGASASQATPSPTDALAQAEQAAISYWGMPSCGSPQIVTGDLAEFEEGMSFPSDCRIILAPAVVRQAGDGPRQYFELCRVLAHEWGHNVLGEDYFAASNPDDPAHSPDMGNLMYAYLGTTTPQCVSSLPTLARKDGSTIRVRIAARHGVCTAENRWRRYYVGWVCPTTDATSPDPAPQSYATQERALTAMVTAG